MLSCAPIVVSKGSIVPIQLNVRNILITFPKIRPPPHRPFQLQELLGFFTLPPSALFSWEGESIHTLWLHMDAVSWRSWGDMEAIGDLCGVIEMFMQGVNVLENTAAPANDEIVNSDDVLGVFRE